MKMRASDTVKVSTFLQDPWVGPAVVREVDQAMVGNDLANDRVRISDKRPKARPDSLGNYRMKPGSDGETQVHAQVVTTRTLRMWEGYRGSSIPWGFGDALLGVVPHKKEGLNASYSRESGATSFYFQDSPRLKKTVYVANSTDVVAHETGHAVLDGMKPGFLNSFDRETHSFHEAFGDCSAMLLALQDPALNERIIAQTGGDLRKPNLLAHLSEEFGKAKKLANADLADDHQDWLRNALNHFTYATPESLGDGRGDETTLGGEVHSFSRLFVGAFYDCLEAAYHEGMRDQLLPPAQALRYAADTMGPLLASAVDKAASNRGRFKDIGLGLILADQESHSGKLGRAIEKVFLDRKIFQPGDVSASMVRHIDLPELSVDHTFSSGAEAVGYLTQHSQELGLPEGVSWQSSTMSVNHKGEQVMGFLYAQSVPVAGIPALQGITTCVQGGVTLAFDTQRQLCEFRHDAVTAESLQAEMDGIAELQRKGRIGSGGSGQDGPGYLAVVRGKTLRRIPVTDSEW
ncbi:hypothetical protein IV102_23685 [bacterium]|nr:hypothetical protein [bacterium]